MKWEKKYHYWYPTYCTGRSNERNIKYRTKHKNRNYEGKRSLGNNTDFEKLKLEKNH